MTECSADRSERNEGREVVTKYGKQFRYTSVGEKSPLHPLTLPRVICAVGITPPSSIPPRIASGSRLSALSLCRVSQISQFSGRVTPQRPLHPAPQNLFSALPYT